MQTARDFFVEKCFKAEWKDKNTIKKVIFGQDFFEMLKQESSFPSHFSKTGTFYCRPYHVDGIRESFELYDSEGKIGTYDITEYITNNTTEHYKK